jgi:glycosyltransferase involved in cell wall biosynthesis
VRTAWGIRDDQVLVLNIGRIYRNKGIFELVQAISLAAARDPRITCVLVGSSPIHDETAALQQKLEDIPSLKKTIRILPACSPDTVWAYLCAADIFAFPSHREGMPNSLLEALAMRVPAVAFAIPPVLEIEAGTGALLLVPPFDTALFAEAIVKLALSPDDRVRLGERGRERVLARFMVQENMALVHQRLVEVVQKSRSVHHRC